MSLADGMAWEAEFGHSKGEAKEYTHLLQRTGPSGEYFTKGGVYLAKCLGVCDKFSIITDQGGWLLITLSDRWKEVTAEYIIKAAHDEYLSKSSTFVEGHTAASIRLADVEPLTESLAGKPTKSEGIALAKDNVVIDAAQKAIELGKKSDGKADGGKVRQSLLQVQFGKTLNSVAAVLTFGARKYPKPPLDDSWKDVPNAKQRYADALYRHLHAALVLGEKKDPESGESHWAHAICNILFLANLKGK